MNQKFEENESKNMTHEQWEEEPLEFVEEVDEESEKKRKKKLAREAIIYVILLFACVFLIPRYVIQHTIVDGPSMEPTLYNHEHLLVEKISYHFNDLDRFDIISFYPFGKEVSTEYYIKRVIGLPGETIQIKGEDIYINGEILEENYGKDPITFAGVASQPIHLQKDEYFVLGDNRSISKDSRSEEVGIVKKEQIGGKAILRIWPLNKFGKVK